MAGGTTRFAGGADPLAGISLKKTGLSYGAAGRSRCILDISPVTTRPRYPTDPMSRPYTQAPIAEIAPDEQQVRDWSDRLRPIAALSGWAWQSPHVSVDADGEMLFEWWQNDRKLSLYFGAAAPEYIKVWGTHLDEEMESGSLPSSAGFRALWDWLHAVDGR